LGVLELKRDKKGEARDLFLSAQVRGILSVRNAISALTQCVQEFAPHNFEPSYNIALLANKAGQYQVRSNCHFPVIFPLLFFAM
jgi:hypothetical protein